MLLNHKLRSSSPCLLFGCFHGGDSAVYEEAITSGCDDGNHRRATQSPRSWLREIRCKCRSLIAWIRRCPRHGHDVAPEFGYDPTSYALNFEDDRSRESDEEFPERKFLARLPVSPDRLVAAGEDAEGGRSVQLNSSSLMILSDFRSTRWAITVLGGIHTACTRVYFEISN